MSVVLVRETRWIKEWRIAGQPFIDSKFRTLSIEPDAAGFVAAWDAADESGRAEMEMAFRYYPYECPDDIARILAHIGSVDVARADRIRQRLFTHETTVETDPALPMLNQLSAAAQREGWPMAVAEDNPWFTIFINDGGLHIDTKAQSESELPTTTELQQLLDQATTLRQRRASR